MKIIWYYSFMYIRRRIEDRLTAALKRDEITVIVGARQTGKTTLLKRLKSILDQNGEITFFINLENPRYLDALNQSPENLFTLTGTLPAKKVYVFIDEVQYLNTPSNFLKYIHDEYKEKIKLIVSGSSAFYIDQKFTDSLAGRKRLFELTPLDFREFLRFKNREDLLQLFHHVPLFEKREIPGLKLDELNKLLTEYVKYGAYPAVVLETEPKEKEYMLDDLFNSFLAKDVEVLGIRKKEKFFALIRILSMQVGNLLNQKEIANTLQISVTAVDNYMYLLEKSYIVKKVSPFFENLRKELTKMPKLFFLDLGIRNMAAGNFDWLEHRMDRGMLFENLVFKLLSDREDVNHINFWRTQTKKEVDFIINRQFAFEIKYNGLKFEPGKYRLFRETYPEIPLGVVSLINSNLKSQSFNHFDLI